MGLHSVLKDQLPQEMTWECKRCLNNIYQRDLFTDGQTGYTFHNDCWQDMVDEYNEEQRREDLEARWPNDEE